MTSTTVDLETIRQKYAAEREKRLRPDGNNQYIRMTDEFAHYRADPHTPFVERPPVTDHVTFAFIGGGFAGLVTGARLKEAGVPDVRIIDRAGDFGGTWYWNRYPGAMCDTSSLVYMPLLEETNYMPTEKYAHGPRSSSTPAGSPGSTASTTTPCSTPTSRTLPGKRTSRAGLSRRTAATPSRPNSSASVPAP